jgi:Tol biopolymer transport system component
VSNRLSIEFVVRPAWQLSCVLAVASPLVAQYGITVRASTAAYGTDVDGHSYWPSLSDDGRYVAFESKASNLAPLSQPVDQNGFYDIFVLDRATGVTKRVSLAPGGLDASAGSGQASISGDGSRVAFASYAWNLAPPDANQVFDIFVVDVATLAMTRCTITPAGIEANGGSSYPAISGDGRYVAYESYATNLTNNDSNLRADVYRFDTQTGVTELVSANMAGVAGDNESGGDANDGPSISTDGRYVAFWSRSDDLVPNDTNNPPTFPMCDECGDDVFVRDMQTGTTIRVCVDSNGAQGSAMSYDPSISGDGRYVAFWSKADNLVPGDTNLTSDVFVHDRDADGDGIFDEVGAIATRLVSVSTAGAIGDAYSAPGGINWGGPAISRNGRYVAFDSAATNFAPLATMFRWNIYVHDMLTGATECTSLDIHGHPPAFNSMEPAIDADGSHIAFVTQGTSLVANDTNNRNDVYVRTKCAPPQVYCTAKVNSLGCTPSIGYLGAASATVVTDFTITATNLRNQAPGLMFYSLNGAASTPFQGGYLCMQSPLIRTGVHSSAGNTGVIDCSGSYAFAFNAYVATGAKPALINGATVRAQFWSRDSAASFSTNLTDALSFVLAGP